MAKLKYTDGWKYRVEEDYSVQTGIYPDADIESEYVSLTSEGLLTIKRKFCFDGPSGEVNLLGIINIDITRDTKSSMRGACIHDALAYLMRQELLSPEWYHQMNEEFLTALIHDGMWVWKARLWHKVVNSVRYYIDPKNEKKVYEAP